MTEAIIIFSACSSEEEAVQIAQALVKRRLAGCVQISSPIRSIYRWKGELHNEVEWRLSIKTVAESFDEVKSYLEQTHSYEVPEVMAVPVSHVSEKYLAWLNSEASQ